MSFLDELKRRKVVRVAVVYAASAFVVLQAADLILPALLLPEWTYRLLVLLALAGLPIALVLAWVLELTPAGVRVTTSGPSTSGDPPPALLGRRTLIAAAVLVLAGIAFGAGWILRPDADHAATADHAASAALVSVAVLPFADLSDDRSQEYFGDGIAEELLNALRSSDVAVASRTSSFAFKGRGLSAREIAAQLGVDHIIDGSVRKAGDRLRISAQVIDVRSDRQLWTETFDRAAGDVFRIQAEIASAVAAALRVRLAGGAASAPGTQDAEAYDLYLLGLYHWNQRTPEGLQRAVEIFTEATNRDPHFARAWAGLSFAHRARPQYAGYDAERAGAQSRAAAERAVQLDSLNAEARTAFAAAFLQGAAAIREYDRAIELDPTFPTAHHWRGIALITQGDIAAGEAALRRALRLDPSSLPAQSFLAVALEMQGRLEEALAQIEALLARAPGYAYGLSHAFELGALLGRAREFEPHLRAWLRGTGRDPDLATIIVEGIEDPLNRGRAIATVEEQNLGLGLLGVLQAREEVLRHIEAGNVTLLQRAFFDFVRDDPRFQAAVARQVAARQARP
jgi:TolB-like protein